MRLIVTEKNNSAKKIAQILAAAGSTDGLARDSKPSEDAAYRVPFYTWQADGDTHLAIGLKGHVLNPAFPEGLENWQKTDPRELIDATLVKEPTDKNVLRAVKKCAADATSLVIATDYDREGELIGLEVLEEILEVNPSLEKDFKRARYSALTKEEIQRAFGELDDLSFELAHAGAARQDIDLIWGATLTRAVSLATRRFGSNFLSVGRVQSPTLGLIVERELERRAHVAEPFWELFARFDHPEGAFQAHHTTGKFWDEKEAIAALEGSTSPGRVVSVTSKQSKRQPPAPFNTTSFTTESSSRLGITPAAAMRYAEDLYMDGFISYPRTDNTVYPPSLDVRGIISSLAKTPEFASAQKLLDGDLKATRGKKETTDHPPIHPTGALHSLAALDGPKLRVYELVVRRFLATFMTPLVSEGTRADIEAGSETYFVRGSVVVDPGFAAVYTYARSKDDEIPKLEEGQELAFAAAEDGQSNPWLEGKETQPPSRLSQGKLIELMEEAGLGTKATRADIIQKLYDRGYVYNNPPEPSETGITLFTAFKSHVPEMATPEMTAKLEAEMDRIAAGQTTKEDVVGTSRKLLHLTYGEIKDNEEGLREAVWKGMDQDKILGPCPECEEAGRQHEDGSPNMLRIIEMRGGKRFCGCQGYNREDPEDPNSCRFSRPLPGRGYELWKLAPRCPKCEGAPRLKVKPFRGRPWELCLNDDCPDMVEMRAKREERRAAREAKEAAKAAAEGTAGNDGDADAGAVKAKAKPKPKGPRKASTPAKSKPRRSRTRTSA